MSTHKSSVLVCVTGQYDCERLIKAGFEISVDKGYDLHVLCVHQPVKNVGFLSDEIEYLYQVSKDMGASMTIIFNENAPKTTVDFALQINAKHLITGMPDNKPHGFIDTVADLHNTLKITMITKENEHLVYTEKNECVAV